MYPLRQAFSAFVALSLAQIALGADANRPEKSSSNSPIVLEVRKREYWSWDPHYDQYLATLIEEVPAEAGREIGQESSLLPENRRSRPFTVTKLLDHDRVEIQIAKFLVTKSTSRRGDDPIARMIPPERETVVLGKNETVLAWTPSFDAGTKYAVRISDLQQPPPVTADAPELVARIAAHASIVKDDRGSVQCVGPLWAARHRNQDDDASAMRRWKAFGDRDLVDVAKLNNLRALNLVCTSITDGGLRCLKDMKRLVYLNLGGTKVTGLGLRYLAGLQRLEVIGLEETDVGDDCAETLTKLERLGTIRLYRSRLTSEGLWALRSIIRPSEEGARRYWGWIDRPAGAIGPYQLAVAQTNREKLILQLLIQGCRLHEVEAGRVYEAAVPIPDKPGGEFVFRTLEQTRRTIKMLGKLDTVESISLTHPYADPQQPPLDAGTVGIVSELKGLKSLGLSRCALTDDAWHEVGRLSRLRELDVTDANISNELSRRLHRELPTCAIRGASGH